MNTDHSRYMPQATIPDDTDKPLTSEDVTAQPQGHETPPVTDNDISAEAMSAEAEQVVAEAISQPTPKPGTEAAAKTSGKSSTIRVAEILSAVLSPLLLPTYCMAAAMWITPLSANPESTRLWTTVMIFFITGLIPLAMVLGLLKSGHVSRFDIPNHRQRIIPFIATALCYVAAAIYLNRLHAPSWLAMMYVGGAVSAFVAALISIRWKISAHAGGMGMLIAMLVWMAVNHNLDVSIMPWLTATILITGILGSTRVYLGRHTVAQILAGVALTALIVYGCMCLGINSIV